MIGSSANYLSPEPNVCLFLPHDCPTAIAMSNSYQTSDRVTTQNSLFFARYFNVVTHHMTSLKQLDSTGVVIDASGKIVAIIFTRNKTFIENWVSKQSFFCFHIDNGLKNITA